MSVAVDKPMSEQVHLKASVAVVMSVPQQIIPLKGLWPKDKSTLEKAHLEASVAVHEIMLEYLKVCGHD